MIHIKVITQHSILVIFLISSAINPLLAVPVKSLNNIKKNRKVVGLFQELKNILMQNGLDEKAALEKTNALLYSQKNTIETLNHFHKDSKLHISKENLLKTLYKYALYEKELKLDSYSSLIGFTQNALARPLKNEELEFLQNIVFT